jgi:hypothetical protein
VVRRGALSILVGALFAWLALAGVGCGGDPGFGSCTISSGGKVRLCRDYQAGYAADSARASCSGANSAYAASACPGSGRVADCLITTTTSIAGRVTYDDVYFAPTTAASVQENCIIVSGQFTAVN